MDKTNKQNKRKKKKKEVWWGQVGTQELRHMEKEGGTMWRELKDKNLKMILSLKWKPPANKDHWSNPQIFAVAWDWSQCPRVAHVYSRESASN